MKLMADIPAVHYTKYAPQSIRDDIQRQIRAQFLEQKFLFDYDLIDYGHHKVATAEVSFAQWRKGKPETIGEHSVDLLMDMGDGTMKIGFFTQTGSWRVREGGYSVEPKRWMEIPE